MRIIFALAVASQVAACSSSSDATATASGSASDAGADQSLAESGAEAGDAPADTGLEAETSSDTTTEVAPDAPPQPPALKEYRTIAHMHTAYSHDGCDGQGLDGGVPNAKCIGELRMAACELKLDVVNLTDHPNYMKDQVFTDDMLYQPSMGDALVMSGAEPIANRMTCAGGHTVLFTVGYEGEHNMPLGLHHLLTPEGYEGVGGTTPLDVAQARLQLLKDAGAVVANVHSEMDDITADQIDQFGFDAMEWYNVHGAILTLLGGDSVSGDPLGAINRLKTINSFLLGSGSGANADLVYLATTSSWPQAGFDKWYAIQHNRPITGLLGTDCHRNVYVEPVCKGTYLPLCQAAAALYPTVLTLLSTGGTIMLSDNERLDSYRRVMSWMENRVLATDAEPETMLQALRDGQSYGQWSVYGEAKGFAYWAQAGGKALPIGAALASPATLFVQIPQAPKPMTVPFTPTDAAKAQMRATVYRTDASGTKPVQESTQAGALLQVPIDKPGAYHVELRIRPMHLQQALGSESAMADNEYLWVITNAMRVAP
jgi:hypothetical protein